MRKILIASCFSFLFFVTPVCVMAGSWFPSGEDETVLTNEIDQVAGDYLKNEVNDPLRQGTRGISKDLKGIYNEEEFTTTGGAWDSTTRYVKGVINYILGIVGLVALLYLIFQGFRVLTAGNNEDATTKAWKGVRYAFLALVGVGIAWFILSIIFRLILKITS